MQEELKQLIQELDALVLRAQNLKRNLSSIVPDEESVAVLGSKVRIIQTELEERIKIWKIQGKKQVHGKPK